MANTWPDQFEFWPAYLPFPTAFGRNEGPVPNRQAVDWPQSQFAPLTLPPGSPSYQPYRFAPAGPYPHLPLQRLDIPALTLDGDSNMAYARYNEGEDAASAQLLDTPVASASASTIVQAADAIAATTPDTAIMPVVPVASDDVAAQAAAAPVPFLPFEPELLEGLKLVRLRRLQKLESVLTKLSALQRTSVLEAIYQRLLKAHDRVRDRLEARAQKRATNKGRRGSVRRIVTAARTHRAAQSFRAHDSHNQGRLVDRVQDLHQIDRVREAYQSGKIGREQALKLIGVARRT